MGEEKVAAELGDISCWGGESLGDRMKKEEVGLRRVCEVSGQIDRSLGLDFFGVKRRVTGLI